LVTGPVNDTAASSKTISQEKSNLVAELWRIALNGCHSEQDCLLGSVDVVQDNARTLGIQAFSCQQISKLLLVRMKSWHVEISSAMKNRHKKLFML